MTVNSRAAALLTALSSPARLRLLSTVADRETAGADRSLTAVAEALELPMKTLVKDVARLADCGLLTVRDRILSTRLDTLAGVAGALVGELPITGLLRTQPSLERYFVHGRLTDVAVDHTAKLRLAPLLARLLPDDRAMTEPEVNTLLGQVHDDYAALRRMLVEYGQLTRDGAVNYRRAG